MKRIQLFLIILFSLSALPILAQNTEIRFVPEPYSVGVLEQGDVRHIVLKGANTTSNTIVLESVMSQNTGASNFKYPSLIKPNETISIEFDLNTAFMEGEFNHNIILVDTSGAYYKTTVTGEVQSPVFFSEKMFDAGYYKAGETIEDGIRELFEETGLDKNDVNYNQLISIGIRQTATTVSPNYIANEFQHIYLFDYQGNPENLVKENNETRGFVELKIDDTIDILTYKSNSISGRYYFFDEGKINSEFCNIRITDFIPSYLMTDQFMLRLIIAAKRYIIQTDRTLLFW